MGPRQSGKATLAREISGHDQNLFVKSPNYFDLEDSEDPVATTAIASICLT
jgi:Fe-S cluster assembly ATPase SufC